MSAGAAASKTAVIVGAFGFGCYPLSLLGALLGLRAFWKGSAPGTPGRGLAILAMLMPGLTLPVAFGEAAALKPAIRRGQIAQHQGECRSMLEKFWAAEEKFHAANGRYTEDSKDLQVGRGPATQRYSYVLGESAWLVKDDEVAKAHLAQLKKLGIVTGQHGDVFTLACVTLVKDWADVWTVTNEDREFDGGKVVLPAGTVHNEYLGVAK